MQPTQRRGSVLSSTKGLPVGEASAGLWLRARGGFRAGLGLACLILLSLSTTSPIVYGDAVFGEVFPFRQPDGTRIEVRVWGDEFYRVVESLDGYTLVRDPNTGAACYARLSPDGNDLLSTGVPVGSALRANLGLKPHLRINRASARAKADAVRARLREAEVATLAGSPARVGAPPPNNGDVQGIVLLVDFAVDEPWSIPASEIDDYCNLVGYTGYGNNGSVRDYFYDVSDGNLTYTNFVPTAYYRASQPRSYYEDNNITFGIRARELLGEALSDLDSQGFDFSQYDSNGDNFVDAVNLFYAGTRKPFWAEGLWPHSSSYGFCADGACTYRYQMTDIGDSLRLRTFCHENGHMICEWPDLYDYGYESTGVGQFCLMCYGASNTNPSEPCAYFKYEAGWSSTMTLSTPQVGLSVPAGLNTSYRYLHPTLANEFFMIENRQQTGRDSAIPDAGLAIWHIDEQGSNNNEQMTPDQHYLVTLVQADAEWDLEYDNNAGDSQDLWDTASYPECTPSTSPNTSWWDAMPSALSITNISAPGATMTFDFNTLDDCNVNGVADSQDVSSGTSLDCNTNVNPDECDLQVVYSSSSGDLSPIGNGSPQSYTLVSPPSALQHVTLYFEAVGDFGTADKRIDVDINGTPVGSVFESGGYNCWSVLDRDGIVVSAHTFNAAAAGGSVVINMVASTDADPFACDSYVRVAVDYESVGASCNQNDTPDDCDITFGTSPDCNANAVPDECDATGGGLLLDADFDGGLPAGWTAGGTFQITSDCGAAIPNCAGGSWAYAGDTGTCTHGDLEAGELVAPAVTLGYGLSTLSFCSRMVTEVGYDFSSVWVNSTRVWKEAGGTGAWEDTVVDLGAFAGQTVTITFHFASDTSVSGALGWQVDNVLVTSGVPDDNEDGIPDECGACCGEQDCEQLTQALCEASGNGEYRGDGTTCEVECPAPIPTVSEWGLVVLSLALLTAGSLVIARRKRPVLN